MLLKTNVLKTDKSSRRQHEHYDKQLVETQSRILSRREKMKFSICKQILDQRKRTLAAMSPK